MMFFFFERRNKYVCRNTRTGDETETSNKVDDRGRNARRSSLITAAILFDGGSLSHVLIKMCVNFSCFGCAGVSPFLPPT